MENVIIRQVTFSDIPYLYKICLETGNEGKDATDLYNDKFLLGHFYASPYAIFKKEFGFVLQESEWGQPCGYILGTDDTIKFNFQRKKFLEPLKEFCKKNENNKSNEEANLKKMIYEEIQKQKEISIDEQNEIYWCKEYPAHLHIDILPFMQKKGYGEKLINKFLENLLENKVTGVHLGVSSNNKNACNFYKKMNFKILAKTEWGYWLGKKL